MKRQYRCWWRMLEMYYFCNKFWILMRNFIAFVTNIKSSTISFYTIYLRAWRICPIGLSVTKRKTKQKNRWESHFWKLQFYHRVYMSLNICIFLRWLRSVLKFSRSINFNFAEKSSIKPVILFSWQYFYFRIQRKRFI